MITQIRQSATLHVADEALSTYQTPPQSANYWKQRLPATDVWKRDGYARRSELQMVSSHIKANQRLKANQTVIY